MPDKLIGAHIAAADSHETLAKIRRAEELGVPAAWMTTSVSGPDPLTIFAAASVQTERILLGTSITTTWPRHPVSVAQQAQVLAQLSGSRFRLGMGPSGRAGMIQAYGADFHHPLGHLREYLRILKGLLQEGSIDLAGEYYTARAQTGARYDVPVMASALSPEAFRLCGAEADGAISWVCPGVYLRDQALPAWSRAPGRPVGRPRPSSPTSRCPSTTT